MGSGKFGNGRLPGVSPLGSGDGLETDAVSTGELLLLGGRPLDLSPLQHAAQSGVVSLNEDGADEPPAPAETGLRFQLTINGEDYPALLSAAHFYAPSMAVWEESRAPRLRLVSQ